MYFYEIEVYYPFYESEKIIMGHDAYFDNHQLNIIVQEAFDECIEEYCNKTLLDEGEEACRMDVETIFKEYLPLQLKNHGFKSIKINATCSILEGGLFVGKGARNNVLKNRYKDEVLPPCKKCIRDECIVPNVRKDTSLPTTHVEENYPSKTSVNVDLNTKIDKTSIKTIITDALTNEDVIGAKAIYDEIQTVKADGIHEGDIICSFYLDTDNKRCKKLLEKYGFILEDTDDDFWITGVKE